MKNVSVQPIKNLLEERWFRVLLVMGISVYVTELGSVDSLPTRVRTADFLKEYLATVLIASTVVEMVYFVDARLNIKVPWRGQLLFRLLLQALFGWVAPLLVVFGMATLYFRIYGVDIMRTDYLYFGFPYVILLVLLLNIVIVVTPLLLRMRLDEEASTPLMGIKVLDGNSIRILEAEKVTAAYVVSGRVVVRKTDHTELLTDVPLDELEKYSLPSGDFFRVNRQLIAARTCCLGYRPIAHGKLEVELSFDAPVNTVVSQAKARAFREWYGPVRP